MAAIAADDKIGADFDTAIRRLCVQADDTPVFFDQIDRLCLHSQIERLIALSVIGDEVEEVPLRHQGNEFAVHRQMFEMADNHSIVTDLQ